MVVVVVVVVMHLHWYVLELELRAAHSTIDRQCRGVYWAFMFSPPAGP